MPVRTAYVGTQLAGDVLTAANFTKLPGGWIGYAEVTADQGSITTGSDLTGLSVAVTVNTNRRIRITAQGLLVVTTAVGDQVNFRIQEGATVLMENPLAHPNTGLFPRHSEVVFTPTAGAHTYKLQASRDSGAGTVTLKASVSFPAYILVEDIGPAS